LKRVISISFLSIFLFTVIGYYAVYLGLRSQANNALKQKLDAELYDESEMLSMRIPLNLPYQSDWASFERVDGDFEQNGVFYNLVKQKVERDTLIVYYIMDHRETTLFEALTSFVHANSDTPMSKATGKLIESFSKDFLITCSGLEHQSAGWSIENHFFRIAVDLTSLCRSIKNPPPRLIA